MGAVAAGQGYVKAQYDLGFCYAAGLGVKKDPMEAAAWYHKAAEKGFAPAQSVLGTMYSTGEGVAQNKEEAINRLLKAGGYPPAEEELARMCAAR